MISKHVIERCKRLREDAERTRQIHELYPPSKGVSPSWPVALAYDPEVDRWVLCYKAEDVYIEGDSASTIKFLKPFYVWQGPDSLYLDPDVSRIAEWLRSHDMMSGDYLGTWEDRQFGMEQADHETRVKAEKEEDRAFLREVYSKFREDITYHQPIRNTPRAMGKYFDVRRRN